MKLYVGNLDYGTTDESLQELFAECGDVVSAKIIMDRETGRSKGFGFVEMAVKGDAVKAISTLNGREINGREIRVNEAQQRPSGFNGGGGDRNKRY